MDDTVKLLSSPVNYAVVQLPGRKYPGVVFQGDSLNSLHGRLCNVLKLLDNTHSGELLAEINGICEDLSQAKAFYEDVCRIHKIELPYPHKK